MASPMFPSCVLHMRPQHKHEIPVESPTGQHKDTTSTVSPVPYDAQCYN